jgi:MazG family protein
MSTTPFDATAPRVPNTAAAAQAFAEFCQTIAALRDPSSGCPWDLQQNHASLRRYMVEEAYEAVEVMGEGKPTELCEELGDVLLQVVLNAQVALDEQSFSIVDVIKGINSKMRRRHPHVFAPGAEGGATVQSVHAKWDQIKAAEKAASSKATTKASEGLFAAAKGKQPAMAQAVTIGKIAAKIRFDWDNTAEVWRQVCSEVDELAVELEHPQPDGLKVAEELGDLYFSLAQLSRHLGLDPEIVSLDANRKFLRRFAALEIIASGQGIDLAKASREQLEALWQAVKLGEKQVPSTD